MSNKHIAIIVGALAVLLLLAAGGYYWYTIQSTSSSQSAASVLGTVDINNIESEESVIVLKDETIGTVEETVEKTYPEFMIDSWAASDSGQNYVLTFYGDGTYTVALAQNIEDRGTWYVEDDTSLHLRSENDLSMRGVSFETVSTDDSGEFLFLTDIVGTEEFEFTFERVVELNRDAVIGSWETDGDFEEISLEADGTYSTFLSDRPFDSGTWEFSDKQLQLISDAGEELNKIYSVSFGEQNWQLLLDMDGETETWNRLP